MSNKKLEIINHRDDPKLISVSATHAGDRVGILGSRSNLQEPPQSAVGVLR